MLRFRVGTLTACCLSRWAPGPWNERKAGTASTGFPDWYPHPDLNGDIIQLRKLGLWSIKLWGFE